MINVAETASPRFHDRNHFKEGEEPQRRHPNSTSGFITHLDEHTLGHTHAYASYTNSTMFSKIEFERKFSIILTKLIISDIFMTN